MSNKAAEDAAISQHVVSGGGDALSLNSAGQMDPTLSPNIPSQWPNGNENGEKDVNREDSMLVDLHDVPEPPVWPYTQEIALTDLPAMKYAIAIFLASHMKESEEFCDKRDKKKERLYYSSGYALIQCVKGMMSFDDDDILDAIDDTKHGNYIANTHRKKHGFPLRLIHHFTMSETSSVGFIKSMTPVERHAELIYAETLFEKALLGIVFSGDFLSFIKEAINMRSTMHVYQSLSNYLDVIDKAAGGEDTTVDRDFRSGVALGMGISNLLLSFIPDKLLRIVEIFGYKGDRDAGLKILMDTGGWKTGSSEPAINGQTEGVRRVLCDMALLVFHLVGSTVTFHGVDIQLADNILTWNLRRYPNGVFFLFGAGRIRIMRGQPREAIHYYTKAMESQDQYPNLHHISHWEIALARFALYEMGESLGNWKVLMEESKWSKAIYAYGQASALIEVGGEENVKEAAGLLDRIPSLVQRIAGKSIPLEKYVARKARKFQSQNQRLSLPALEFLYMFLAMGRAPRDVIANKFLPAINARQEILKKAEANPSGYENGEGGYWDDLCLALLLEGVCLRYLAYPDPDCIIDETVKIDITTEDAAQRSQVAFQTIFTNGSKIALDHFIVYFAHYEYGRLRANMGNEKDGRHHLELVLSGGYLETNPKGRKGKYSMESTLILRAHAAVEALDVGRKV